MRRLCALAMVLTFVGAMLHAGGRLPTEKEWEAEASNNGSRKYPWGDEKVSCERAVMREEGVDGCGRDLTWPVCSKTLGNSVSGLCDMSGP
ncbi:MAG: SUMF1/EgtB/PvdO family nonheme iron enzyme [Deltaproteobacteria bacterium]|nr:SUMF1/EgtB/PvdO family nonheme iron enzyme [Deltaproteobacteria bacterium]